jgi:hypothetical protein
MEKIEEILKKNIDFLKPNQELLKAITKLINLAEEDQKYKNFNINFEEMSKKKYFSKIQNKTEREYMKKVVALYKLKPNPNLKKVIVDFIRNVKKLEELQDEIL